MLIDDKALMKPMLMRNESVHLLIFNYLKQYLRVGTADIKCAILYENLPLLWIDVEDLGAYLMESSLNY